MKIPVFRKQKMTKLRMEKRMKCIILCAGYATRLRKYINSKPKALITIQDKPILNYLIEKIEKIHEVTEIIIVSNKKYYNQFLDWQKNIKTNKSIKIIHDNTSREEEKLGAIGDIQYVINHENIEDDMIVMASDNFFDFDLNEMMTLFHQKQGAIICTQKISDIELLKRLAVARLDRDGKVIDLIEKPQKPKENRGVYTTYIFKKEVIQLLKQYITENNNPDAPGYFIQWLYKRYPVYSYNIKGECYDIGDYETLREVRKKYEENHNNQ